MARKTWGIADTVAFYEVILDNEGTLPTNAQYVDLMAQTGCSRGSAETMAWRAQTVLGFNQGRPPAKGITRLDVAVAKLYRARDPRVPA